jgi:hypothetical protein
LKLVNSKKLEPVDVVVNGAKGKQDGTGKDGEVGANNMGEVIRLDPLARLVKHERELDGAVHGRVCWKAIRVGRKSRRQHLQGSEDITCLTMNIEDSVTSGDTEGAYSDWCFCPPLWALGEHAWRDGLEWRVWVSALSRCPCECL